MTITEILSIYEQVNEIKSIHKIRKMSYRSKMKELLSGRGDFLLRICRKYWFYSDQELDDLLDANVSKIITSIEIGELHGKT